MQNPRLRQEIKDAEARRGAVGNSRVPLAAAQLYGRMVRWDIFRADLQQGPIPGTGLFLRKDEQLAFFPRMGGNCLLSDHPGCRDSRDSFPARDRFPAESFPAHTGLTLRQDLS